MEFNTEMQSWFNIRTSVSIIHNIHKISHIITSVDAAKKYLTKLNTHDRNPCLLEIEDIIKLKTPTINL